MPRAPKRCCLHPTCPALVEVGQGGRCDKHRRQHQNTARLRRDPKQGARYRTARWYRLRRMVLARDPLCVLCREYGRLEPAVEVDHIVPVARGGENSMDNLQGLCHACHSGKTMRERHVGI